MTLEIKKIVGIRIRKYRNDRGFTQEELAHKTGLHRAYVGQIERGEKNIGIENLMKIAKALKVRLDDLVTDERGENDGRRK